jgi:hypothetical protein
MWVKDSLDCLRKQVKEKNKMATILDLGLLNAFDFIFPFILIWAVLFSLLQKTKVIGDSPLINAVVSVAVGFSMLLSRTIIDMVNLMIPWFAVAIIFFIMMLLLFMLFGVKDKNLFNAMANDKAIRWVLIVVAVGIFIGAFATVTGQDFLDAPSSGVNDGSIEGAIVEGAGGDFQQNIILTLRHPKILGILAIFGVAIAAVGILTVKG